MTAAAWHPDPTGQHELRYWDGSQWTEHVSDGGVVSTAPLQPPAQAEQAQVEQAQVEQAQTEAAPWTDGSEETSRADADPLGGSFDDGSAAQDEAPAEETPADDPFAATRVVPQHAAEEAAPSYESATPSYEASPPAFGGAPPAYSPDPAAGQAPYGQQPPVGQPAPGGPSAYGDAFGGITGDLVDGRYSEVADTPGPSLQNGKMLKVRVNEPFMARQGSMVAYQGNVNFAYQGGGAAKFLKKAVTGEGLSLMRVEGQGDVFLADTSADVHILHLNNSGLSVNGKNILAFSSSLQWNIERVKGGSMAAGGLFNTTLRGTGWVAITTDGHPVVLNAQEAPTFADANALVAWSIDLQTGIKSSFTAGALIGRGSGEAFQVTFNGPGFVIVQPSEGYVAPPTS